MRAMLILLLILVVPGYAMYSGRISVPDGWNPWATLHVQEPLHWLTRWKLARLSNDERTCLAVLSGAQMSFEPVPDRETAPGCGFDNAVRITRTSARVGEAFTLSCPGAVALALWEQHVVQPAARAHFGSGLARLEHFGSYSCRGIYGRKDARLSRHATADALDVSGFVLENGRRIRVERDWGSGDVDALFLREVRDGACRVFDGVLGPDYNAAHRNHFHLDRGAFRVCR